MMGQPPIRCAALEGADGPIGRARDLGLGRTAHAGEGRPADEIALERMDRAGHAAAFRR